MHNQSFSRNKVKVKSIFRNILFKIIFLRCCYTSWNQRVNLHYVFMISFLHNMPMTRGNVRERVKIIWKCSIHGIYDQISTLSVYNFCTAKLLFWRNNRIWRKGLACRASSVASHQDKWYYKKILRKGYSVPRDFSWIENDKLFFYLPNFFNMQLSCVGS